jgi:hypothetical protein
MKSFVLILTCFVSMAATGQSKSFPQDWAGNWKGELSWYKTGNEMPKKVNMELRIQTIHAPGIPDAWTWQIIYGSEAEDNRPYKLVQKDSAGIHWAIDENNGIIIDQYWTGNKFCGAFTVQNSTIINTYWKKKKKLIVEFYSISARPVSTTGKGTEDSPNVASYKVGSYQKAVLTRQ